MHYQLRCNYWKKNQVSFIVVIESISDDTVKHWINFDV